MISPTITDEQAAHFREHGYVTAEKFFTPDDLLAIRRQVDKFKDQGKLRNVSTDDKLVNLQLVPLYDKARLFAALPFQDKIRAAITALIGDPAEIHLDQLFLKPGGGVGMGTHWHADNAYFKISDPLKGTAMWIAVDDATVENGTLRVIPGSFRENYPHERDPMSDHHIRCFPPEERAVDCELEAGGVVFFCYGTVHSTGDNNSDRERLGVAYHFLRTDYVTPEIQHLRAHRPQLTGADATNGVKEYGEDMAKAWLEEKSKVLADA